MFWLRKNMYNNRYVKHGFLLYLLLVTGIVELYRHCIVSSIEGQILKSGLNNARHWDASIRWNDSINEMRLNGNFISSIVCD